MQADSDRPWSGVLGVDEAIDRRTPRPRRYGVTMVIDTGLGQVVTADTLELAAPHIDHWKFGFGTSAMMSTEVLRRKLSLLARYDVLTYPGGTLLEAAIVQQHCRDYMRRASQLGFKAVEISDGTIELPRDRRARIIDCARNAGLIAITEVGKKDPGRQPTATELAEEAINDIDRGAAWVVIEARESGVGIGIYDGDGFMKDAFVDDLSRQLGDNINHVIWEAPRRDQQAALVKRFGPNVGLGNVAASEAVALAALRAGLRYETLSSIAERQRLDGAWDPSSVEHSNINSSKSVSLGSR